MQIYQYICILNAILVVNAGLVYESYNIRLEDSIEDRIEELFKEEDYQMIKDNELEQFHIDDKENKLYQLHKLARKEYKRNAETKRPRREWFRGTTPTLPVITDATYALLTMYQTKKPHHIVKRNATKDHDVDFPYDYDYLVHEYYDESIEEAMSNQTFHSSPNNDTKTGFVSSVEEIVKFDTKTKNCTEEELKHIGFKAVNCIYQDYRKNKLPPKVLAKRLWRIIKIWFIVYLVVATPLWCTRGWCCCCLFCKFFKPRVTIDRAKSYFVKNPPGVLMSSGEKQIQYEPSYYEIQSYEEFDHFIITI